MDASTEVLWRESFAPPCTPRCTPAAQKEVEICSLYHFGMQGKLTRMTDDSRKKLRETLERIINEGSGGLICIIL